MTTTSKLKKDYITPRSVASFGGVNRLKKLNPAISEPTILNFLHTQDAYTKHKRFVNNFKRRKVVVPGRNYLWQIDLVIINKFKRFNSGYSYLLNCIDAFSRYAFSVPVKTKHGSSICDAFTKILNSGYGKCHYVESDDGSEFKNKDFKLLLAANNIKLYSNNSDKGACIVERFNRTLMTRVYKYLTHNRTKRFVDVLDDIVYSYNHSIHRTLQCTPASVNKYNESEIWRRVYKDLISAPLKQKQVFHVGDYVRLKQPKGTFTKGYSQNFTNLTYQIREVVKSIPITYKVKDGNDNILGTFYAQELSKVVA